MSAIERAGLPVLAVTLPQFTGDPGRALDACVDARRVGFGGAFVFDHFWPLGGPRTRPSLECWTLLAAVAAQVGRRPGGGFRVGTLVTRAGLRAPAVVARMAATVGEVAGVAPIVGVGRGDVANRAENLAFGLPFGDAAERTRAVEDTVAALRGPLAAARPTGPPEREICPTDRGTPSGFPGPLPIDRGTPSGFPGPLRPDLPGPPEVWVGGNGAGARQLAGRVGDAWNGWGLTPEELAAGLAEVREAAEGAGRDPGAVGGSWGGQVLVADGRREAEARLARWGEGRPPAELARVVAGDPETVLARLRALGDAGAAWCVLAAVGGPGAEARALLADAAGLPGRQPIS